MDRHEYPDGVVRLIILTNTSTLWAAEDHTYVDVFHIIESAIIIFSTLSSLIIIYLGCTIRAAHSNLINIIHLYEVLYIPFALSRITLILVERQIYSFTGDLSQDTPFLLCGLIQGWFLMTHSVKIPAMLCERLWASFYIADYELKDRSWITVVLFLFIGFSSFIMTVLTHVNIGSYYACTVPALILQISSVLVFVYIYFHNKKMDRQLDSKVDYSLSRKFQVIENWKIHRLIRTKIIATAVIVVICCVMMSVVMTTSDSLERAKLSMILQLCFSGFPLIMNVTLLFSFESWRDKILRTRRGSHTEIPIQSMGDIHFAQIESQWK